MIFIDPESETVKKAHKNFIDSLTVVLNTRLRRTTYQNSFFQEQIKPVCTELLSAKPDRLYALHHSLLPLYSGDTNLIKTIRKFFNYTDFTKKQKKYGAYNLAKDLDINTCVYCNRNFTSTVFNRSGGIIRPQFDHYFDKDSYPLLSLSFYNLIPCCALCNSKAIKGSQPFTLLSHIHPYVNSCINEFSFSYTLDSHEEVTVHLNRSRNILVQNFLDSMRIQDIYSSNSNVVSDLITIKKHFSDGYLAMLEKSVLNGVKISKEELYRLAFGAEINEIEFSKRPLSKLKYDILKELNIIT